jgi:hypothetical protein
MLIRVRLETAYERSARGGRAHQDKASIVRVMLATCQVLLDKLVDQPGGGRNADPEPFRELAHRRSPLRVHHKQHFQLWHGEPQFEPGFSRGPESAAEKLQDVGLKLAPFLGEGSRGQSLAPSG